MKDSESEEMTEADLAFHIVLPLIVFWLVAFGIPLLLAVCR